MHIFNTLRFDTCTINFTVIIFAGRIAAICLGLLALAIGIVLSSIPWVDYLILRVSMKYFTYPLFAFDIFKKYVI